MLATHSCPAFSHNVPLVHWIASLTGECIYGNLEALSWVSQYISIAVWVSAGTYQSWELYRYKDVSGFSEGFIRCWIIGAFLNVFGCLCTGQMPFQVFLGFYFLFSDSFLYFQYKYYQARPWLAQEVAYDDAQRALSRGERQPLFNNNNIKQNSMTIKTITNNDNNTIQQQTLASSSSQTNTQTYSTFTPAVILGIYSSTASAAPIGDASSKVLSKVASNESHLMVFMSAMQLILGTAASWGSNTLYFVSRFPQIKRNFERRSCEGVSPALFIATLFANISYCITIACAWSAMEDMKEAYDFVMTEMPFIAGAIATTLADMVIFAQFYLYSEAEKKINQIEEFEGEEQIIVIEAAPEEYSDDECSPYSRSGSSDSKKKAYLSKN